MQVQENTVQPDILDHMAQAADFHRHMDLSNLTRFPAEEAPVELVAMATHPMMAADTQIEPQVLMASFQVVLSWHRSPVGPPPPPSCFAA